MPEWTTAIHAYLPEETIKALLGIGVVIAGIWIGIRRFSAGKEAGGKVPSTRESDLRQSLAALAAESREMHGETQEMVGEAREMLSAMNTQIAVLMDRTSR